MTRTAPHSLRIRKSLQRRVRIAALQADTPSPDWLGQIVAEIAAETPNVDDVTRTRLPVRVDEKAWRAAENVAETLGYRHLSDLVNERLEKRLPAPEGYL